MIRREATSNPGPKPPSCEDIDLDGLVYRELSPVDELIARSHIAACPPCRREHDELVAEHRAFAARARASEPAPLPSFDQLMARAPAPPTGLGARWRALVESWSSPWRGAVLQGAVGMFAVGMLVQVAILRPRATETPRSRPVATAAAGTQSSALDPWGESIAADAGDCDSEIQVCEDLVLASHVTQPASDPCAGTQAPASIDWSLQPSSGLESADAVCAADAI